jgi:hypothetical protein
MAASPKVNVTKDYRLFHRSVENRSLDEKKHKKLFESMKLYGFLACYPIICCRNGDKQLVLKDGQHRLMFAERLNLPVFWIEEAIDFDVAVINSTPKIWVVRDYAEKFAAQGKKVYQEGLDFTDRHGLAVGIAFAMLAGNTGFTNIRTAFIDGTFKIKDREWAERVATTYAGLVQFSAQVRNARLLEACMSVCRVAEFDPARLLQNAKRCREKLVSYSTKEAYLDMLEAVYNFGRKTLLGLKSQAVMAMRDRNPSAQKD